MLLNPDVVLPHWGRIVHTARQSGTTVMRIGGAFD
jgi:hypothetical protein